MNLLIFNRHARSSHPAPIVDDGLNDWLGGEAWVTPQLFAIDKIAKRCIARREDPATDWIPL